MKAILQEELGLQEKAKDERRPGYQARVKKKEGREESDLRKTGKGDDRESRKSQVG